MVKLLHNCSSQIFRLLFLVPLTFLFSSHILAQPLSGTQTVGVTGDFTSFTNAGGVFEAIMSEGLDGNLVLNVISDISGETGAFELGYLPAMENFSITVRPDANTMRNITGSVLNKGLFSLDGAKNIIIDGRDPSSSGTGANEPIYLRFSNTNNSTSATFELKNGSSNNTFQYAHLDGLSRNNNWGNVKFSGTTNGQGNSDNIIQYCLIGSSEVDRTHRGIVSIGNIDSPNRNNQILHNSFLNNLIASVNFSSAIVLSNGTDQWLIEGNSFYQTIKINFNLNRRIHHILVNSSGSFIIKDNYFGGSDRMANGTFLTDVTSFQGWTSLRVIQLTQVANDVPTIISGNTFTNYYIRQKSPASSSDVSLIESAGCNNCNIEITDNNLGSFEDGTGDILFHDINLAANMQAIRISDGSGGSTYKVSGNKIRNLTVQIDNASTNGRLDGFIIDVKSTSEVLIEDNEISNLLIDGSINNNHFVTGASFLGDGTVNFSKNVIKDLHVTSEAGNIVGLRISNVVGNFNIYNNFIALGQNQTANPIYGIYSNAASTGNVKLFNNSVAIAGTATTGTANTYAMYRSAASQLEVKNNVFFNGRSGVGEHLPAFLNTEAGWQADYNLYFSTSTAFAGKLDGTNT
ncbi:MAG: hypothetical protein ACFCUU_16065, partial [Cyclobacteriaceae bacterium]